MLNRHTIYTCYKQLGSLLCPWWPGQWHGSLLHLQRARSRHCYCDLPCYRNITKKRTILHNQLRPASLKDLINWLIGFWCNQEVIRGSGSHVVHWCIFVLIDALHAITAQMRLGTWALLAATCPHVKVKYGSIYSSLHIVMAVRFSNFSVTLRNFRNWSSENIHMNESVGSSVP
jgi:hypothetical protein